MSESVQVMFDEPLHPRYADDLRRHVFYAGEEIEDFSLLLGSDGITGLEVRLDGTGEKLRDAVARKLRGLVAAEIVKGRDIPRRTVWEVPRDGGYHADLFAELSARDQVFQAGAGQVAVGTAMIRVMDYFDERIRRMAIDDFGAAEYRYPTLIPSKVVQQCGYFDSFPQFMMFVTRLHSDFDNYERFIERRAGDGDVASYALSYCADATYCLPPATCFHIYQQFADRTFEPGQSRVVTASGKAFRFESKYEDGLERLWDFTMREFVFLGEREFVRTQRDAAMGAVQDLLRNHGMGAYCEVATDPFFIGTGHSAKMTLQALAESKYELRMGVAPDRSIAVGSFNYHDAFFGQRFSISYPDGRDIKTGCVAFGLERLAYAFLCQHGLDEANWPMGVAVAGQPHPVAGR